MGVISAGKSKHHTAVLSIFHRAKRRVERAGLTTVWEATVTQVRADRRRKTGFMSDFENLIAGGVPREETSFLQRAKARWNKRAEQSRRRPLTTIPKSFVNGRQSGWSPTVRIAYATPVG